MRRKFNKKLSYLFFMLAVSVIVLSAPADASSVKNKVETYSNTGGNSGSDNITTGNASAKSSVSTKINGEEDTIEIKTEVRARANGEEVEIKTEGNESVSIEKESGGAKASVEINTNQADANQRMESESTNNEDKIEDDTKKSGIVEKIWNNIAKFFRSIF